MVCRVEMFVYVRGEGRTLSSWLLGKESSPFGWADLVVVPLIAVLSVPGLVFFGRNWTVVDVGDSARYLMAGSQFISGESLEGLSRLSEYNGGHGPGLPALIGFLILFFGHDPEPLAWATHLMTLLIPLLAYLLVKRISNPLAGLLAAALLSLLGFTVDSVIAISIDPLMLTFYLLSLLGLMAAIASNRPPVAFLSGTFLALSILTKETGVASVPLALVAVLLLDWDLRMALWHYLGLVLVSLPWWVWAYSATGEVYLMDRLPDELQTPALVAAAVFVVLAAVAYATGIVDRFLADRRRRRWTGWFVTIAWTVLLSGMLLATAPRALASLSFQTLRPYLANLLEPAVVVVPTLLVVLGYVAWKAFRQNGPWGLLALAMLFQVPVCLLVMAVQWAPRQFLILQTLLLCALAALVVEAGIAAFTALRERDYSARLVGALVAIPLAILLLVGSVQSVQAMLSPNLDGGSSGKQTVAYPEIEMNDWVAENVPEEEHILLVTEPGINVTALRVARANYLTFLDAGRHELTQLQLDQPVCSTSPNMPVDCDWEENEISRIPPDAIWVETLSTCSVISLSMSNLLEQMHQSNSDYVLISGTHVFPGILQLPQILQRSNAFELAHFEPAQRSRSKRGVVLLKRTGQEPKTLSTQMTAETLMSIRRCERTQGQGYQERIRSTFPNGLVVLSASSPRKG
jgi:4-amino-4-deoxy-L-arabinose transferase-like glycosyltransferase